MASDKKPVIINLACISRHYYFFQPACNTLLSRRAQTSPSSASAIGRFHLLAGSHPCRARCCVNKWLELIKGRVVYRVCLHSVSTECVYSQLLSHSCRGACPLGCPTSDLKHPAMKELLCWELVCKIRFKIKCVKTFLRVELVGSSCVCVSRKRDR